MDRHRNETSTVNIHMNKPAQKRRWGRWLSLIGGIIIALILILALLLTYFFPSELVRKKLEVTLSNTLEASVRIDTLSFNLLTGLELERVTIHKQAVPLIQFDRLNLDYRLLALLKREIQINEILIDNANISLNLEKLGKATQTESNPTSLPPASEPSKLPVFPLSINLERFEIAHATIQLTVNPTLHVGLTDLNVNVAALLTDKTAALSGSLKIQDMRVNVDKKNLQLPVDLDFALQANLDNQRIRLHHLTLQSVPAVGLTLSGTVNDILTSPSFDLSLKNTDLDLEHLLAHITDFVPPDFQDIQVTGQFKPEISVRGQFLDSGFNGEVTAMLKAQGFHTHIAPFQTTINPMEAIITVPHLEINNNVPEYGEIAITLSSENMTFQNYALSGFQLNAVGNYAALGTVSASLKTTGISSLPSLGSLPQQTLPFDIALNATGNYRTQALTLKRLVITLGDLLDLKMNGVIAPAENPTETVKISLAARLEPHIDRLVSRVPGEILQGISISKNKGVDTILFEVTSMMDPHYNPIEAEFSGNIKLQGVSIAQDASSMTGTFDTIRVLFSGKYDDQTGRLDGTIANDIRLSQFRQGKAATLGSMALSLRSHVNARLNAAHTITALKSEDALSIHLKNIGYTAPSLQAAIDELRIHSKTQEDLVNHKYKLHTFRMMSPHLLDVSLQGHYHMQDQQFSVLADLANVRVDEILKRLGGKMMQDLKDMNPQGTLSLAIKGVGRVPEQADIDQFHLPLSGKIQLGLDNIHGAFAQYQIHGARGTISTSFINKKQPVAEIQSNVQIEKIELPPDFPLSHISDAVAELAIVGRDMDEINVEQLHVGMKGANVNVIGSMTGLKDLFTHQFKFGQSIGKAFIRLKSNTTLAFDEFQPLFEATGLKGTGQAQMNISVLKKEHGPLDVRLQLGGRDMTLRQNEMNVINLDGLIDLQKRLMWKTNSETLAAPKRFHPSDVLSQLRSITGQQKSLRIDRLELGKFIISNFSTDILFNRNAFKIQNLAMNILGGGLGGSVIAVTSKPFGVSANLEVAQLDLNYLLSDDLKIAGDSSIDATIGLSIFFEKETGALDLSKTELRLFITHIGKEALDRLLLFLDPEGSNPTIVNARSKVRLANPSQVSMQLTRGMLGFEIHFSQGLLSSFRMNRIPAGSIKSFQNLTQGIPDWDNIQDTITKIGAEFYGVDEEGNLVLQ